VAEPLLCSHEQLKPGLQRGSKGIVHPTFFWTLKDNATYQKAIALEGWESGFDLLSESLS